MEAKFENLVCMISQKLFELEPSYLEFLLGLSRRLPATFQNCMSNFNRTHD